MRYLCELYSMLSFLIYHSKVDKFCQKSRNNLFNNYVIPEGGGVCQKIMLNYKGGGGVYGDHEHGLIN